ncbi:MAG: hypothetical protein JXB00_19950 [Bacteroidales bacterium]|nr:hypothetical protein [Bacteroidales bacterium]
MRTQKNCIDPDSKNNFNDRLFLAMLHLSSILPLFFPAIIIHHKKKDEIKEMTVHFRAVMALQSFIFFIWILGFWGFLMTRNSSVSFGILVIGALFSIINSLKVLNNQPFKYFGFFSKRLISTR